jgi:ketosteroid isomerase-like protein
MDNLKTTQQIYDAFGRGDIPSILGTLADTVEWEYGATVNDAPWLQPRLGREGAGAFFASLGGIDIHRFAVKAIVPADRLVVVLVDIEFTVRATGRRVVEQDEVHLWHFDAAGRVARFRHRVDTHAHHLACQR